MTILKNKKPGANPAPKFRVIQEWRGHVIAINPDSDTFEARLLDLTKGGTDETAEFKITEVPASDLALVQKGAAFLWQVGYWVENGRKNPKSVISFFGH